MSTMQPIPRWWDWKLCRSWASWGTSRQKMSQSLHPLHPLNLIPLQIQHPTDLQELRLTYIHQEAHLSVILKFPHNPRPGRCRAVLVSTTTPSVTNRHRLCLCQIQTQPINQRRLVYGPLLPWTTTWMGDALPRHDIFQQGTLWKRPLQLSLHPTNLQPRSGTPWWWCLGWEPIEWRLSESWDCWNTDRKTAAVLLRSVNAALRDSRVASA